MTSSQEQESVVELPPANTATALVFLAAFSVIISWLVCYALPPVLVSADLMSPWPNGTDPRPNWMLQVFTGLFVVFAMFGLLCRWLSNRQMRRIDAMADD
ncbi:MAG: hypothetical protein ABSH20_14415 [Tepidisphaeraceae bacterium]|jgi:hypothetical protein